MSIPSRRTPPLAGPESACEPPREHAGAPRATLELGQVAFLLVTDLVPFGAFVDWGLPKELLVPFAEQLCEMREGERYAIGLTKDNQGRFIGTQRVSEMLREPPPYKVDDWVEGQAWRRDDKLGVFVIVEKQYLGLLPASEPHDLKRGSAARFRVSQVFDGKIQLSLRRHAIEAMQDDAERILAKLKHEHLSVGDHTDPETVRIHFGLSKKAFKRALGRLLKQGLVELDEEGNVLPVRSK